MIADSASIPGLKLRNRLVVAPMTTYSSYEDGTIRPSELDLLRSRAESGFGMVMTAACYVHKSGHAFPGQWACSEDQYLDSLASAAIAIRSGGAAAVLQIHHGGRQCPSRLTGETPWSASAIANERPNAETPRAMTESEIEVIIDAYAAAALRAKQVGYDAVEIHGANTYLLQQFVSPHSNRREDAWGIDRLKFPLAVVDAVIERVGPDFPVGYRFSPEETETPGIRWHDTERLIVGLCARRLSFLHVSLGKWDQTSLVGDFEEPTLARVARTIDGRLPLIGVGSVWSRSDYESCRGLGADLVAVGRAAIVEPNWPRLADADQPVRRYFPSQDAESKLNIPEGLANRIRNAPGWFPMEEPSATA